MTKSTLRLRAFPVGTTERPVWLGAITKTLLVMKLTILMLTLIVCAAQAKTGSAQDVTISGKQLSLEKVFAAIKKQTGYAFLYTERIMHDSRKVSLAATSMPLLELLPLIFKDQPLDYTIKGKTIFLSRKSNAAPMEKLAPVAEVFDAVKGLVTDSSDAPIVGVTVSVRGKSKIVLTDIAGRFSIDAVAGDVLIFSHLSYETFAHTVKDNDFNRELNIMLLKAYKEIEEVVVTGMFNKDRSSFVGAVKSLSVAELKSVSNTNLIAAIAMLTPGMRLVENNSAGSSPNNLPEIVIRGNSSLSQSTETNPNQPLIILDGIEISLRDLYDIDINEIERVDILKDASASAFYGERAANGVIVVERKKVMHEKLRLMYNMDGAIETPDISSYDYLNAAEKLEFERLAGLYNFEKKNDLEDYNRKKLLISKGINTDWMSRPLRTGMNIGNSIGVSGKSNTITYRLNLNTRNVLGVMKGDYRTTYGISMLLSHYTEKLMVSLQSNYNYLSTKNSPYGSFSSYAKMNPYDNPVNGFGDYTQRTSWDIINPLYEANAGSFNKGGGSRFTNSLSMRWNIQPNLFITSTGTITVANSSNEVFLSPLSAQFRNVVEVEKRGTLTSQFDKSYDYSGNLVINYNKQLGEDNLLTTHIGGDIFKEESTYSSYQATGFLKANLHSSQFAVSYPEAGRPGGNQDVSARLGVFANLNFITHNKYFVDATIRRSGSSKFGANNRYAPFWSAGAGWNIHNEAFMDGSLFNMLRLRYSYGVTGNISFSPYQAMTTYLYSSDLYYLHGMGTIPVQMGNPDLSWQSTYMHNVGFTGTFLNNRINVSFDYYVKTTDDLLMDQTIPPSVGESSIKTNLGKIQNKGFEIDLGAELFKIKDWRLYFRINGAHNTNKILAISNALKKQNDISNASNSAAPLVLFEEGHSTTAIYAVRSAGINPANGREIFIKKDGTYTLAYDHRDKVVLGEQTPTFEGGFFPNLYYKNWSLAIAATYRFGGQIYNSTRAENVEQVNPRNNVDRRAFEQRWKNVNDIVPYLDIVNTNQLVYNHTSRFIEDDNAIEIRSIQVAYEFSSLAIKKMGLKRFRIGVGMNDPLRITSVNYERGTTYPFSRGFSFTISPTF